MEQHQQENENKTYLELSHQPAYAEEQAETLEDIENEVYEITIAEEEKSDKNVKKCFPKPKVDTMENPIMTQIAKRQLEQLTNLDRKHRKSTSAPTSVETYFPPTTPIDDQQNITFVLKSDDGAESEWSVTGSQPAVSAQTEITKKSFTKPPQTMLLKNTTSLTSTILSKNEVEEAIKKSIKQDKKDKDDLIGTIEIPQELIFSSELASPSRIIITESEPHLESQELIDILEGNDQGESVEEVNYEIVTNDVNHKISEQKNKLIEREIAIRQMMTLPKEKTGRKPRDASPTTKTLQNVKSHAQELVDSLVSEWTDEKGDSDEGTITLEIKTEESGQPSPEKVKILNVDILSPDNQIILENLDTKKSPTKPKILNKNAPENTKSILNKEVLNKLKSKITTEPKILNKEAAAEPTSSYKRQRIIKKKVIWDPTDVSISSIVNTDRKSTSSPETNSSNVKLPAGITLKKISGKSSAKEEKEKVSKSVEVTKETAGEKFKKEDSVDSNRSEEKTVKIKLKSETESSSEDEVVPEIEKPAGRKRKPRSELDKLLADEGAINMIYSLERENKNTEVPEIEVKPNKKSLINLSKEKNCLLQKAKAIKNAVTKQSISPGVTITPTPRVRVKKEKDPEMEPAQSKSQTKITQPKKGTGAGRKRKDTDEWGYVYAKCDDSMIIRRRSNSSYDSSAATSPRRLSIDASGGAPSSGNTTPHTEKENFEFIKPTEKSAKTPSEEILTPNLIEAMKGKLQKAMKKGKDKEESDETPKKGEVKPNRKRPATSPPDNVGQPSKIRTGRSGEFSHLQIHRFDEFVHVVMTPDTDGKLKDVLTIDVSFLKYFFLI